MSRNAVQEVAVVADHHSTPRKTFDSVLYRLEEVRIAVCQVR